MKSFEADEQYISQIPALIQLINLGYEYITPAQVMRMRGGKTSNVILEDILDQKLREINSIQYKGKIYKFSEENIQAAIENIKTVQYDGLLVTNEATYNMLTLPQSMEQKIDGNSKSFNLKYIDWENYENNAFHVTAEFPVACSASQDTKRPDIVLFVNGIPLCVIECKTPKEEIDLAIEQNIRNQSEEFIPKLFTFSQLILAVNKNKAKYATTYTSKEFWSEWKEQVYSDADVDVSINTPLTDQQKDTLFCEPFTNARKYFETLGIRKITVQDRTIHHLCKPERLMQLTYRYTFFDNGIKKIARYQQYFVVKETLKRISSVNKNGQREGGMIWHTQGSGKSLTMVMLARNISLDKTIRNPRLILVTDRKDLDKQLMNTFIACGISHKQATSGKDLIEQIKKKSTDALSTVIDKFQTAIKDKDFVDESDNTILLIDEAHRSNFGNKHASMRKIFPNASIIGFTGTPLIKEHKNNFRKFGKLIEPHYSIQQAVEDGAVVPLLYEGRMVDIQQNKAAMDLWFEKHTEGLTPEQKADLKRKYARADQLNTADQVVYMRAFDISEHFKNNWKGTPFKGQIVTPNKKTAIKFKEYLDFFGDVKSEVVISPPDVRESREGVDDEPTSEVVKFWEKMMKQHGSEEKYNDNIINRFNDDSEPELLIVVSKLLTGFDAPRDTVLYICSNLKDHTLLQAIARVNRLYEGKEYGYIIDYMGLLGNLDRALTMYTDAGLADFDEKDLEGTLTYIGNAITSLPQKHANLLDIFSSVQNKADEEAYEELLHDNELRESFYEMLYEFSITLGIALSSEHFLSEASSHELKMYKDDLKRFQKLKASVKIRYAESIDYRDYEPKIKKLLDTHLQANEVIVLNELVNIFNDKEFNELIDDKGITHGKSISSKADFMAHTMKATATEKMDEDPAFYEKFSKMIQDVIDAYKQRLIDGLEYFKQIKDLREKFINKAVVDMPKKLETQTEARAFYGNIREYITSNDTPLEIINDIVADTALEIANIFKNNQVVMFWQNTEAQNKVKNEIDDYLYDIVKGEKGLKLTTEQMDNIINTSMRLAEIRSRK